MSSEELREDVKAALRRHEHDAEDLRDLSNRLERMAERYETQDEIL